MTADMATAAADGQTGDEAPDGARPPEPGGPGLAGLRWVVGRQRRSLVLWSVAVAAVSAIYAGFWNLMGDPAEFTALIEGMPDGLVTALGYDAIGTPTGYLESTVFGLLGPVLLLVFGIGFGARVLAGEEEQGTLELEVALPVSRRRVALERFLALEIQLALLTGVLGLVVAGVVVAVDMAVALDGVLAAVLGLFLLTSAIGTVALAAGAVTGRRGIALAVGAGLAVVAFMADALAPLLENGDWLAGVSPFGWYLGGDPLVEGLDLGGNALLLALTGVALLIGVARFERRDLGV